MIEVFFFFFSKQPCFLGVIAFEKNGSVFGGLSNRLTRLMVEPPWQHLKYLHPTLKINNK